MLHAILAYICSHFENDALAMNSYSSVIPECLLLWDYCKTALIHTVRQGMLFQHSKQERNIPSSTFLFLDCSGVDLHDSVKNNPYLS